MTIIETPAISETDAAPLKCSHCQGLCAYTTIVDKRTGSSVRAEWVCSLCGRRAPAPLLTVEEAAEYVALKMARLGAQEHG